MVTSDQNSISFSVSKTLHYYLLLLYNVPFAFWKRGGGEITCTSFINKFILTCPHAYILLWVWEGFTFESRKRAFKKNKTDNKLIFSNRIFLYWEKRCVCMKHVISIIWRFTANSTSVNKVTCWFHSYNELLIIFWCSWK